MNDKDILRTLKIIINSLKNEEVLWKLEGSSNLRVLGINTSVSDIDITTNLDGFEVFRKSLKKYHEKEYYNEKTTGQSMMFDINGIEVEINLHPKEFEMLDKIEKVEWNGITVPTLSLKNSRIFYEKKKLNHKVKIIDDFLDQKNN